MFSCDRRCGFQAYLLGHAIDMRGDYKDYENALIEKELNGEKMRGREL
jgi:hypothetical protein